MASVFLDVARRMQQMSTGNPITIVMDRMRARLYIALQVALNGSARVFAPNQMTTMMSKVFARNFVAGGVHQVSTFHSGRFIPRGCCLKSLLYWCLVNFDGSIS
jgi:hypothetical protein